MLYSTGAYHAENPYVTVNIAFINVFQHNLVCGSHFTYYCKIKSELKLIRSMKTSNKKKDHSHFKLAVAMTATMEIFNFLFS